MRTYSVSIILFLQALLSCVEILGKILEGKGMK